tara:strand:+ start:148 stop:492 length:345 start_codon:yes stop_codon:yes gene_type:complete
MGAACMLEEQQPLFIFNTELHCTMPYSLIQTNFNNGDPSFNTHGHIANFGMSGPAVSDVAEEFGGKFIEKHNYTEYTKVHIISFVNALEAKGWSVKTHSTRRDTGHTFLLIKEK